MSYLSFENNIIEASGNLILKSNGDTIDCCGCNLINVSNITSSGSGNSTSFNSDVDISGNLTIDGSLIIQTGELTLIKTKDLDISDNIIGLNQGHTVNKNTSGMLINYGDASNIFFGYHDLEKAFVIAHTDSSHNDSSITLDSNYVDLKVGKIYSYFDTSGTTEIDTKIISSNIPNDASINDISYCKIGESKWKSYFNDGPDVSNVDRNFSINVPHFDNNSSNDTNLKNAPIIFKTVNSFAFMIDDKYLHLNKDGNIFLNGDININSNNPSLVLETDISYGLSELKLIGGWGQDGSAKVGQANLFWGENNGFVGGGIRYFCNKYTMGDDIESDVSYSVTDGGMTVFYRKEYAMNEKEFDVFYYRDNSNDVTFTGQITALSFNATSDYRTKTNIEELDENITVSNLRPLVYLKNGQKEIGLLAHELQEVYPFMVCGEKDGKEMQSVNYNGLIGVLINDVKRLTNENQILKLNNDTLKSDYDTLKSDYDTLKSENNDIKSRLDSLEEKFNKKFE